LILLLIFVVRTVQVIAWRTVSEMTYNVSSGTLNLTHSLNHFSPFGSSHLKVREWWWWWWFVYRERRRDARQTRELPTFGRALRTNSCRYPPAAALQPAPVPSLSVRLHYFDLLRTCRTDCRTASCTTNSKSYNKKS